MATHAAKEGIWLHCLIAELFTSDIKPTPLYCDNQAANKLVITDNYHMHTKHINVHFHFIQQAIKNKIFDIIYCSMNMLWWLTSSPEHYPVGRLKVLSVHLDCAALEGE
jgi:hypothetical protein